MKTKTWITARLEDEGNAVVRIHGAGAWTKDKNKREVYAGRSRELSGEMVAPVVEALKALLEDLKDAAAMEGAAAGYLAYNVEAGTSNAPPSFGLDLDE